MGINMVFAVMDLHVMAKYNWKKSEKNHHTDEGGE